MELREIILIILQVSNVISKKRYKVKSLDDSIENILYYKDCNHKSKTTEAPILRAASPPKQQECKMCCTMCCGDQCIDNHQTLSGRQLPGTNQMYQIQKPKPQTPIQPIVPPSRGKRKKVMPSLDLQPPITGRRDYGVTKEYIKGLISQDTDIRKILKDLVSVTMQKVDLMKRMGAQQTVNKKSSEESDDSEYEIDMR